jgi:carbohydrate diacid regulator
VNRDCPRGEVVVIDILLKSAQALVDATHQIIGYDVLITDNEGIIIGANDPGRVGLLHAHSLEVIRRGVAESLDGEQAAAMKVKPGICLPIRLGKRIMGTIGISGAPIEVQKYGHLVQKEAELFLRERALQESSHLRESAVASLVQQIVSFDPKDMNESILHAQGNSLGYDLSLPRVALLVDIRGFGKVVSEVLGEETYGHDAELRVQTIKMMLLKDIRAVFNDPQDLVSNIGSDKYIVLQSVSVSPPGRAYGEKARARAYETLQILSERGYSVSIGIGALVRSLEDYRHSYQGAWKALTIGKKLRNESRIHEIRDYGLEELLLSLNRTSAQETVSRNLDPLFDSPQWNEEMEETLREWLASPCRPGEVAERLGIHRNTLSYRLDKIGSLSGTDLKETGDIFKLTLSLLLRDLHCPIPDKDLE